VDDSKITASFTNGVLDIHVPKAALPQPKKIVIGGGDGNTGANSNANPQVQGKGTQNSNQQKSVPVEHK